MKTIKKYTAIQLGSHKINDTIKVELEYGEITGPYYDRTSPETEFETEDEALEWAYKENKYTTWLILPIIKFDTN